MLTDIEIAQQCKLRPIAQVARQLGILEEETEPYGRYKAKLNDRLFERLNEKKDGKLILVTAINPTPAGEGKTTTTAGLGRRRGRRLCAGPPDGGYQPSLYRRHACHSQREQPSLRDARQPPAAGERFKNRPALD